MAQFKPYDGEIIPLDEEEKKAFTPYQGEIVPLDDENNPRLEEEIMANQPMSDKRVGGASTLPEPSDTMYEGMSPEDARDLYQAYKKHPDSEGDWLGRTSYRGQFVKSPTAAEMSKSMGIATTALAPENIAGGVYNAGRETLRTASALNESADNAIGDLPLGLKVPAQAIKQAVTPLGSVFTNAREGLGINTEKISEALPRFKANTPEGQMVTDATEIGTGLVAGMKINPQIASRVFNGLVRVAAEAGAVAGSSDEDQTLLLSGDEAAWMDIMPSLGVDPEGNYSDELMKKRFNAFVDAFTVAKGGEIAGSAAMAVSRAGKGLINLVRAIKNPDVLDKETAIEITQRLGNITVTDTPEEIVQKMQGVSEALKKGEKEFFPSGVEGIDDVTVTRDSAGAFMKGRGDNLESDERFMAEGLRANVDSKGGGQLQKRLSTPSQQYERAAQQTREAFGGDEAMEATGVAVKKDAQKQLDTATQELNSAETTFKSADKELAPESIIPQQEALAPKIEEKLNEAKGVRNEAHNKVEGWADRDLVFEQWNELKEGARDSTISKVDAILKDMNGSYQNLHNDIKPRLSKLSTSLFKNGEGGESEIVEALRKKITGDDQLEYLSKTGGEQTIKTVDDAKKATQEFGKVWNDGLGGEYNKNLKRHAPFQEENRLKEGRTVIEKASKEGAIPEQRQFRKMMGKEADDYLNNLNTKRENLSKAKEGFDKAKIVYKREEKRILDGVLKNWKDTEGIDIPGAEALPKYFGSSGELSVVKRLVEKATADSPEALNGVKSAFTEHLLNTTRTSSQTSAGRIPLRSDALKDKKLMSMGDAIYGKDSTEWKLLKGTLKEALDIQNSSQAATIPISKLNKIEARTRGIVDVAVTQIWGHLSRVGSRVRSVARLAIPGSNDKIIQSYDKLMANAGDLAKIIDSEIAARKGVLNRDSFKKIYRAGALIGAYSGDKEDEESFIKDAMTTIQTEEMFNPSD